MPASPMNTTRLAALTVMMLALLLCPAHGQDPATTDTPTPEAETGVVVPVAIESGTVGNRKSTRKQRAAGMLSYMQVSMRFEETPLKDALRTFFRALDLNHAAYYRGMASDSGIAGDVTISLEIESISAHRGLELILAVAQLGEPYTWQLRGSVVEVGTMARLGRSGEQRSAVYPIKDLTLDVPYFDSSPPKPGQPNMTERLSPRESAARLMHHIGSSVHPEAWLPPTVDDDTRQAPSSPNGGAEWSNLQPYLINERTGEKLKPQELFLIGRWAKMHYHRGDLIVTAPDFIHRALNGYPGAVMPDPGHWKLPVVAAERDAD
jgi:hypothetical protein